MEEKILVSLADKLGLKRDRIIKKAAEYMRLADIRGINGSLSSLNTSGSCKGVMCLEIAAMAFGDHVDKMSAIRLSGMKNKKMYNTALRAMECLLGLQSKVTVSDLAVQFGCPEAKQLTLQVLKRDTEQRHNQEDVEFNQMLFNSAALCAVCRHLKHRVEKGKFVEITGVPRALFDRVVVNMDTILNDILKEQKNAEERTRNSTTSFSEQLEKMADDHSSCKKAKLTLDAQEEEPFEIWKDRILETAYKSLGKIYRKKSS